MKKILYLISGLIFWGCNTTDLKSESIETATPTTSTQQTFGNTKLTKEDSLFVSAVNSLKEEGKKAVDGIGKKVADADARECEREYVNMIIAGELRRDNVAKKKITESVSFNLSKIMAWLSEKKLDNNDRLNVSFGVYTKAYVEKYKLEPEKIGRLTVFLRRVKVVGTNKTVFSEINNNTKEDEDALNLGQMIP